MALVKQAPIYIQVAKTIQERILSNRYQAGDYIPSAKDLEKEFGVSNITIRKALDLLVQDGYLIPKQGVGTQVAQPKDEIVEIEITGSFREWMDSALGKKFQLQVDVLDISLIPCPRRIQEILSLGPHAKIWRMQRLRKISSEPISYYVNYGPAWLIEKVRKEDFKHQSFLKLFQEIGGIKLTGMTQQVRAFVADMDLSKILKINFGDPLFFVENIYNAAPDKPVEVTHMYYRGDRYVYKAKRDL